MLTLRWKIFWQPIWRNRGYQNDWKEYAVFDPFWPLRFALPGIQRIFWRSRNLEVEKYRLIRWILKSISCTEENQVWHSRKLKQFRSFWQFRPIIYPTQKVFPRYHHWFLEICWLRVWCLSFKQWFWKKSFWTGIIRIFFLANWAFFVSVPGTETQSSTID